MNEGMGDEMRFLALLTLQQTVSVINQDFAFLRLFNVKVLVLLLVFRTFNI